jgi:hypothetical protein
VWLTFLCRLGPSKNILTNSMTISHAPWKTKNCTKIAFHKINFRWTSCFDGKFACFFAVPLSPKAGIYMDIIKSPYRNAQLCGEVEGWSCSECDEDDSKATRVNTRFHYINRRLRKNLRGPRYMVVLSAENLPTNQVVFSAISRIFNKHTASFYLNFRAFQHSFTPAHR